MNCTETSLVYNKICAYLFHPGGNMQITIIVSGKEEQFLQKLSLEIGNLRGSLATIDEAVHECIRMAMYEEAEESL